MAGAVRNSALAYAYAANNPLRHVDPTSLISAKQIHLLRIECATRTVDRIAGIHFLPIIASHLHTKL